MAKAIVVFSGVGPDRIIADGGSQPWGLNVSRARESELLIVTQNANCADPEFHAPTEPHGTAFLVGTIKGFCRSPLRPDRYKIEIGQYAHISIPNFWRWRYPVRYSTTEELGLDVASLAFNPIRPRPTPPAPASHPFFDIAEAKRRLAESYHVQPEAIEIVLRG